MAQIAQMRESDGRGWFIQPAEKRFQTVILSEDIMILRLTAMHENGTPPSPPWGRGDRSRRFHEPGRAG